MHERETDSSTPFVARGASVFAHVFKQTGAAFMSITTLLAIVLIIALIGAVPAWPHSRSWGYYPSGGIGIVLLVVLLMVLSGRL
jgi:Protein of unknown function (DUF3309)